MKHVFGFELNAFSHALFVDSVHNIVAMLVFKYLHKQTIANALAFLARLGFSLPGVIISMSIDENTTRAVQHGHGTVGHKMIWASSNERVRVEIVHGHAKLGSKHLEYIRSGFVFENFSFNKKKEENKLCNQTLLAS